MGRTALGCTLAACVFASATTVHAQEGQAPAKPLVVEETAPAPARQGSADATMNFNINLLGVLQFGPVVAFEFGERFAFHVRLRPLNAGVLSYFVGYDEDSWLRWGVGVGAGFRYYFGQSGNMRGFYLGAGAEGVFTGWGQTVTIPGTGSDQDLNEETHYVAPSFDIGYRIATANGALWSFGGTAGYAVVVDSTVDDESDLFVGMLVIEWGRYF